jgi:hypothetical protein
MSYETNYANPKLRPIAAVIPRLTVTNLFAGYAFEIVAWALFFSIPVLTYIVAVLLGLLFLGSNLLTRPVAVFLVAGVALTWFIRLRRLGRRHRTNFRRSLTKDKRDPVLYLRSFYREYGENLARSNQMTDEEVLCTVLRDVGPVIAVGKPGTEIQPQLLGATRIYLENAEWQETVAYLTTVAQLVVIDADISQGLMWEIKTVRKTLSPDKLCLSLLSLDSRKLEERQRSYERFIEHVDRSFRKESDSAVENPGDITPRLALPETIGNADFIVFNQDWSPQPIESPTWKRLLFWGSSVALQRATLRPWLKERKLKLRLWKIMGYFLVPTGILLMIYLFANYSDYERPIFWLGAVLPCVFIFYWFVWKFFNSMSNT